MSIEIKIAICDDSEVDIDIAYKAVEEITKELSNSHSFNVSLFRSGQELLKNNEDFHILLLDVEMPGLRGFEVADELNKRNIVLQ